jgi:transposase/transposase InsO family protein
MEAAHAFTQLQLRFVDQFQQRYELIRPLILFEEHPTPPQAIRQRAQETGTHPETVRKFTRRFEQQGLLGLLPATAKPASPGSTARVSQEVIEEITRLKGLYDGFQYQELVRIIWCSLGCRITDKTAKKLWQRSPARAPSPLPRTDYHGQPDRTAARLEVVKLYAQGWNKHSISRFLHVSRPTVDRWIHRFEAEDLAGLLDRPRGPQVPRKVWFPLMVAIYHLQKAHPDAGEFRIWSLLANNTIAVRTVGRVMALNRQVYEDIPRPQGAPSPPKPAQPHPYKARAPHEFWFIDGRMMDFAFDGVKWWSIILLDGYSRTILAGAIAPVEASWVTLMVLYTACLRYGAPQALISDSGGAYTAHDVTAVLQRLAITPNPIVSTHGESYRNLLETHFNIQRRLYDYQFAQTTTPAELEQLHQTFLTTYNTTAHQGLVHAGFQPPIPLQVLGTAKGRLYTPEELVRKFSQALFPRTTNCYGCVTLHRYHFYVEAGLPQTPVLLWVDGERLRAVVEHVVLAEYHCRYDWQDHHVKDVAHGVFYPTRFASPQGTLFPGHPQDALVFYRPQQLPSPGRRHDLPPQLWLFELLQLA